MGSEEIQVVDPTASLLLKIWLLALVGLLAPTVVVMYWPDFTWVGKTERALNQSIRRRDWQEPWQPIDQKSFSSGWVRCGSLEDAVRLDQRVDDGHPHTGNLVLSEGGVTWLGR
ncbi:MAG: hypothetical protein ACP5I4_06310 [Oceanipulchritudo sp.]